MRCEAHPTGPDVYDGYIMCLITIATFGKCSAQGPCRVMVENAAELSIIKRGPASREVALIQQLFCQVHQPLLLDLRVIYWVSGL